MTGVWVAEFSAVALTAVATTVVQLEALADTMCCLRGFSVSFDGTSAVPAPAIVELNVVTLDTNTPTDTFVALSRNWLTTADINTVTLPSVEPATLRTLDLYRITPKESTVVVNYRDAVAPRVLSDGTTGFAIRITPAASVNVSGTIVWSTGE